MAHFLSITLLNRNVDRTHLCGNEASKIFIEKGGEMTAYIVGKLEMESVQNKLISWLEVLVEESVIK